MRHSQNPPSKKLEEFERKKQPLPKKSPPTRQQKPAGKEFFCCRFQIIAQRWKTWWPGKSESQRIRQVWAVKRIALVSSVAICRPVVTGLLRKLILLTYVAHVI